MFHSFSLVGVAALVGQNDSPRWELIIDREGYCLQNLRFFPAHFCKHASKNEAKYQTCPNVAVGKGSSLRNWDSIMGWAIFNGRRGSGHLPHMKISL